MMQTKKKRIGENYITTRRLVVKKKEIGLLYNLLLLATLFYIII